MFWAYRATFKQTAGGGGSVRVNLSSTERFRLLYGLVGPNDYAAGRATSVLLHDSGDNIIGRLIANATIDNARLPFPVLDDTPSEKPSKYDNSFDIGPSDEIRLTAAALIQNEELTVTIRALIDTTRPTTTTTGSGGTVTTTVAYDKVM